MAALDSIILSHVSIASLRHDITEHLSSVGLTHASQVHEYLITCMKCVWTPPQWKLTYSASNVMMQATYVIWNISFYAGLQLASFPGSHVREEEREPGTHCSCMWKVPLVTCILLHYIKITVNSVYLLKGHTAWLYSLWDSYRRFWSQNNIALMVTVCIASFEVMGNFIGKDCVSHVPQRLVGMDKRMEVKSWVPSSLPHHRPHRALSVAEIFYRPYPRDYFVLRHLLPDGKSARMSISCRVYSCKWRDMKGSSAWFFWFSEAPNVMRL